ncbi:MAG: hypothetical protein HOP29_12695 [Phycisphaerales bacterium]|nr:hypothetical protein [Phycisphaerales bacterium]
MPQSLDNPINWSFNIGRVFGIRLRMHLLFVLGALVLIAREMRGGGGWSGMQFAIGQIALLFVIVLLHEFGHCFGARSVGGSADEILLWPLGGLAYTNPPHRPGAHLVTVAAGPAVNVALMLITGTVLIVWHGTVRAVPLNPFDPFRSGVPVSGMTHYWLVVFFGLNMMLLVFNLAPVFPFDGGRILQCLLWYRRGFARATQVATGVGMVGAMVIGVLGVFTEAFLLIGIAFFGYVTCWQQRQMLRSGMFEADNEFGYDFSRGFTSLDGDEPVARKPSWFQRRRAARALAREERERRRLDQRRERIDAVLEKVHRHGVASLTPPERRLLEEETERQRTAR